VHGRSEEEKQQGRDAIGRMVGRERKIRKIRKIRKEGRREECFGNIPTCIPHTSERRGH
jgi:hypothetical protein